MRQAIARLGRWTIDIVNRIAGAAGFQLVPRRWVVERTLAWLNRNRRLAKDFEASTASAKAWLYIASIQLLLRRVVRALDTTYAIPSQTLSNGISRSSTSASSGGCTPSSGPSSHWTHHWSERESNPRSLPARVSAFRAEEEGRGRLSWSRIRDRTVPVADSLAEEPRFEPSVPSCQPAKNRWRTGRRFRSERSHSSRQTRITAPKNHTGLERI
jgi:hypothetical protein